MRIAILAGESSGDVLGADLMAQMPDVHFEGVGGEAMSKQGLSSLFPMNELSVMGIGEILPRLRGLYRRINQAAQFVIEGNFDALITIDSPDFSFRVAKRVKAKRPDLKIIHYVAPSVWAWRSGRAKKMAPYIDHVLCLLPFEPPYMERAGMSADFVGHPVSKSVAPSEAELSKWKVDNGPVIGLFPGSRGSEMRHHLATYAQTWRQIQNSCAHKLMIPVGDHVRAAVESAFEGLDRVEIVSPSSMGYDEFLVAKSMIMYGGELAIATSGTVSFELAWAGTPTIVCYDTGAVTKFLYKRMVKVKWGSLANLLCAREVIPELIFVKFSADMLSEQINAALIDPNFAKTQRDGFSDMRTQMQPVILAGPSVMRFLEE